MKALLKNVQGTRRVILICTLVMMFILIAYNITFFISEDNTAAVIATVLTAIIAAGVAVGTASVAAFVCAIVAIFAVLSAFAFGGAVAGSGVAKFAFAGAVAGVAIFARAGASVVADQFQSKTWKVLAIYLNEAELIGVSILMPSAAIFTLIALVALSGAILAESRLCLWLRANPPPSLFVERVETIGTSPFRQAEVIFRQPRSDTWLFRLHRKLYSLYSPN